MSLLVLALAASASAAPAVLCRGGKPALPVVVSSGASPGARRAAKELADGLGRLCGAAPKVREGGDSGIILALEPGRPGLEDDEAFILRSSTGRLLLAASEEAGLQAGAAELLHLLGLRRFFPGPEWEIAPARPDLELDVDRRFSPSFRSRRIWYGTGLSAHNAEAFERWSWRNRLPGAFDLRTGHAFAGFLDRNAAAFKAHPEYLGLVDGRRTSDKFCLSNAGLRRLIVDDVLARFAAKPELMSVSLEPSDGGGWCQCPDCAAMGAPSERLVRLANEVSAELEKSPRGHAGFYAYHRHSPPPASRVGRRLIVSVATAYLEKGWTPESLMEGWAAKGAVLGVREYYGVFKWHAGLPGRMAGGDPAYVARSIPRFHALGARYFSAESGEDWGAHGLGHYVAARLLWDVSEASRLEEIKEDFLAAAFGPAKEPMRRYWSLVGEARLSERALPRGLARELYAALAQAHALAADDAARARVASLALYVRYVELYDAYESAFAGRQEAYAAAVRHVRRMKGRMLVHVRALTEWAPRRDKGVRPPPDDGAAEYTQAEAEALLREGAARG